MGAMDGWWGRVGRWVGWVGRWSAVEGPGVRFQCASRRRRWAPPFRFHERMKNHGGTATFGA